MTADERAGAGPAAGVDEQDTEIGEAVRAILASRPSFAVGDRVRITGGIAECRFAYATGVRHFPETAGAPGEIVAHPCGCDDHAGDQHDYVVRFTPEACWMEATGVFRRVVSQCFAATELELV